MEQIPVRVKLVTVTVFSDAAPAWTILLWHTLDSKISQVKRMIYFFSRTESPTVTFCLWFQHFYTEEPLDS